MNNTNVITIEKNVPIPEPKLSHIRNKYLFVSNMEIGDSFVINGNTPDFSPTSVRSYIYGLPYKTKTTRRYAVRTLKGGSKNPLAIRVWRIK